MRAAWKQNRPTALFGIDYPIIQGPLGGLSSQRLTAAVSNSGGLGSFGAHSLAPDAIKDVVAEIRALTAKPFAMNLWVSMEDDGARSSDKAAFYRSLAPLAPPLAGLGAPHLAAGVATMEVRRRDLRDQRRGLRLPRSRGHRDPKLPLAALPDRG